MNFTDQGGVSALIRLLLGRVDSGHPQLSLTMLPDFKPWCVAETQKGYHMI